MENDGKLTDFDKAETLRGDCGLACVSVCCSPIFLYLSSSCLSTFLSCLLHRPSLDLMLTSRFAAASCPLGASPLSRTSSRPVLC